jgi:hypothetical protein
MQIFSTVKASISGVQIGGAAEDLLMPLQRSLHVVSGHQET